MIKIIGLDLRDIENIKSSILKDIEDAQNIYTLKNMNNYISIISKYGIKSNIHILEYEEKNSFDDLVNLLLEKSLHEDVVYLTAGNPITDDMFSAMLISSCRKKGVAYQAVKSDSLLDDVIECFEAYCDEGYSVFNGYNVLDSTFDKRYNTIIMNASICSNKDMLKDKIVKCFGNDKRLYLYDFKKYTEISVDDVKSIDDNSYECIYIPHDVYTNDMGKNRDIYDLFRLVSILRGKDGCPWDMEQNHKSIENSMIEESYEVVDAIEKDDKKSLKEELGDVLFQIVFHVSLEENKDTFDFNDVVSGIFDKMVFRHPHVFGDVKASNTKAVLKNWDALKNKEKSIKSKSDELDAIASYFPALIRANKVQKKVSKVGFDFKDVKEASLKINEEIDEVLDVYSSFDVERIKEEVGDLLFSVVNVARLLEVDPEECLRISTDKFISRFKFIESEAVKMSKDLHDLSLDDMNFLWEKAKNLEK